MISKRKAFLAASAMVAAVTAAVPASALVINLRDVGGVTGSQAELGFRIAADYWQSVLTSNVTMNIDVGFSSLGAGILGGTRSTLYESVPMQTYYDLLASNTARSTVDTRALGSLRPLDANGGVNVLVPGYLDTATQDGVTAGYDKRLAPTASEIGNSIAISSANVKALVNNASFQAGLTDANIQFSSDFAFDFNPADGVTAGTYDFIGVAVHEIGHALGFLSGAEDFDFVSGDRSVTDVDDIWWGYAADMFRYSAPGQLDWTYGTASYFSLDGGRTPYLDGFWSTGSEKGDGWQASHWKEPAIACVNPRGIMNPYICDGEVDQTEGLDLALLDAIGWNTNVDVARNPSYAFTTAQMFNAFAGVPESSTWAMMIVGMGAVGAGMRRRRTAVRFA